MNIFLIVILIIASSGTLATAADGKRVLMIGNFYYQNTPQYLSKILQDSGYDAKVQVLCLSKDAHASAGHNWHAKVGLGLITNGIAQTRIKNRQQAQNFPGKIPNVVLLQVNPSWDKRRKAFKEEAALQEAVSGYGKACAAAGTRLLLVMVPGLQMLSQDKKKQAISSDSHHQDLELRSQKLQELSRQAGNVSMINVPQAYAELRAQAPNIDLHAPVPPWDGHLSHRDRYFSALCMARFITGTALTDIDIQPVLMAELLKHSKRARKVKNLTAAELSDKELQQIAISAEQHSILQRIANELAAKETTAEQ